ncbi:MAG: PGF-CTERM sorting domain-containing protein [Promethearchaeota archaeon]
MKRNQRIILAISIFIVVFCFLPIVAGVSIPVTVLPGMSYTGGLYPNGVKDNKITYTMDGIVDVFVSDDPFAAVGYLIAGEIPEDALASQRGNSGTLCVSFPDPEGIYYVIIGNYGGTSSVTGEYEMVAGSCGIPGFEILIAFCALLAAFGILWSKKKLKF